MRVSREGSAGWGWVWGRAVGVDNVDNEELEATDPGTARIARVIGIGVGIIRGVGVEGVGVLSTVAVNVDVSLLEVSKEDVKDEVVISVISDSPSSNVSESSIST
jgi:hypothetical protein